jgi:AcrR family transcriptional regulator
MTLPTRDQILDAAAKVFAEHGFRGATTRLIADAADVNEVTLFRLFGSKDALLGEAIRTRVYEREMPTLPDEPGDAHAELTVWAHAEHSNLTKHRSSIRQGMTELSERPDLSRCMAHGPKGSHARLQKYITRLIEMGRAAKDTNPVHASAILLGALFSDVMSRDMMPETLPSAKQAPAVYVEMLLRSISYTAQHETVRRKSTSARAKRSA